MKPIPDAVYHSVVKMGMYCPMAAEKEGKYHAFFSALQSAGNRGIIDLSALEEMFGLPVAKLLMPLFQTWEVWGLLELIENNGDDITRKILVSYNDTSYTPCSGLHVFWITRKYQESRLARHD